MTQNLDDKQVKRNLQPQFAFQVRFDTIFCLDSAYERSPAFNNVKFENNIKGVPMQEVLPYAVSGGSSTICRVWRRIDVCSFFHVGKEIFLGKKKQSVFGIEPVTFQIQATMGPV